MHTDATTHDTAVDVAELLVQIEYDRELLQELCETFNKEFPRLQFELKDALMRQDLTGVQTTAHTLKGMLASLSLIRATVSAKRIEQLAAQGSSEEVSEELEQLELEVVLAQETLSALCSEVVR